MLTPNVAISRKQVSSAMAFELPLADRFSVADIDPHTSYLCNRGYALDMAYT